MASSLTVALAPVHQDYLLEARQMQALSFAVHIPLVCFPVAFLANRYLIARGKGHAVVHHHGE